jgi:FolB domain-containing protein
VSDRIRFTRLVAPCHIGVTPEERLQPQNLLIDIELEIDLSEAGTSDDLAHTIDYSAVTREVVSLCASREVALLERLAQLIVDRMFADNRVTGVSVEVGKETPPIPESVDGVSVKIERAR